LEQHGASKVCISIDAENGISKIKGRTENSFLTAISVAMNAKRLGFKRIVYSDVDRHRATNKINFEAIQTLTQTIGMRVTASGGVTGIEDLLKLQEMEKDGLDSVIVGHALYENKFSCQAVWRMSEEQNYPYTAKI
ncbi:MAG: 1-(5-phosphoribosyl)-5-((5-phosphoribosylamino)methylideneamino)imidazole-4-carboxamide isomerase, partial [Bacteroidetes bacterium]